LQGIGGIFSAISGAASMPSGPGPGPTFDVIAGQQQQQAYDAQATSLGQQANYATLYGAEQVAQNNYQVTKTQATQEAQFSAAGVDIKGSPLSIMTETQQLGNQVSTMISQRATLDAQLLSEQGLQALRSGAAAAFGGQAQSDLAIYNYQVQKTQAMNGAIASGLTGAGAVAQGIAGFFGGSGSGGGGNADPGIGVP
jgi:hypothetical protein